MRFWEKRKKKGGRSGACHEHLFQIIVSKEELKYQLQMAFRNENLIRCLVFGKDAPDYGERLLKACLKLQFIGSLFYPAGRTETAKLPRRAYEALFDRYLDSEEEAGIRLRQIGADDSKAGELYQKYTSVKQHCLRMLSSERETYFAGEYREIIVYITACAEAPRAVFRGPYCDLPILPTVRRSDSEYGNIFH